MGPVGPIGPAGTGLAISGTGLLKAVAGALLGAAALLVDADVSASAAIAGSKISPIFGSQAVSGTGFSSTAAAGYDFGGSYSITAGIGAPSSSPGNGSLYLRTDGTGTTGLYTRQGGAWTAIGAGGGAFTAGGDLGGNATSQSVLSVTGAAGTLAIATTAAIFSWASGAVSPTLSQVANGSDVVCNDFTIAAQSPWASATAANRKPGNVVAALGSPTNGGTTEAGFLVTRGGTKIAAIQTATAAPTIGYLFLGPSAASPAVANNYAIAADASTTYINAPSLSIICAIASVSKLTLGVSENYCGASLNWSFGGAGSYGGGVGAVFLPNAGTIPTSNPTGGTLLYSTSGGLGVRTVNGIAAQFGLASSDFFAMGATPALSGRGRFSNADAIVWRNGANTGDVNMLQVDVANNIVFGDAANVSNLGYRALTAHYFYTGGLVEQCRIQSSGLSINGGGSFGGGVGVLCMKAATTNPSSSPTSAFVMYALSSNGFPAIYGPAGILGTTVGAAGTASAMPVPAAYEFITINGTTYRRALFN